MSPTSPQSRCPTCKTRHPGTGRCPACDRAADTIRGSAAHRGYGTRHRTMFRRSVLTRDPVCVTPGCHAPATVADHWPLSRRDLEAQGLDPDDPRHGRGLCANCHNRSTARTQPGGWNQR